MPMPSSSHRPRFLNDASLDATAPSLTVISTVLLVVVSVIAYSIINNSKSEYPLANPPRWYQTSLSKRMEFLKEGHKFFENAKKTFVRMHSEKRLSFAAIIRVVSSVTPDLLSLIARISSHVFIGEELCRNEKWLRVAKAYATEGFLASIETTWCPNAFRFLLPLFSQRCKSVRALHREASELIDPLIQRRRQLKDEAMSKSEPAPVYDDTVEWAEIGSQGASYDPSDMQLFLSFAAIHTSTYLLA
ncbi:hypothetical protein CFE70_008077 [Pyrenophora teres f. teres 0-1]